MRAGDLRRKGTLQKRRTTRDASGQQSEVWDDVARTSAAITGLSGRELELAKSFSSEVTYQIDIRYRPNVTAADRFVYEGRIFDIHAVIDVEMRHKELQLMCSEGINNG